MEKYEIKFENENRLWTYRLVGSTEPIKAVKTKETIFRIIEPKNCELTIYKKNGSIQCIKTYK